MATFNLLVSLFLAVASLQIAISEEPNTSDAGLLVLTVATDTTDGLDRFLRSAKVYGHRVKVLGQGEDWRGGDVVRYPGGGQKVRILREEVAKHKDNPDLLIMFTDSYDVILNAPPSQFLDEFQTFGSRVVFSAESVCWPDESLADKYPEVPRGKRFLNSGAFIGYAPEIYEIVTHHDIEDADDDQLYYTKIFLDEGLRKKLDIKLDHKSQLFQNINGATSELVLGFRGTEAFVENTLYSTVPLLLHGNGPTKQILNHYGNYLAKAWNPQDGCMECKERMNFLDGKDPKEFPRVMLALFIEQGTPFIEEWFKSLSLQEYPKDRMDLFIHNAAEYHDDHVAQYVREFGKKYASLKVIHSSDNTKEWHARNLALEHFTSKEDAEWLFSVDSVAHLDNPYSIKLLVEQNRTVIAPLLIRPYKAWSNFWGALTTDGFYARSPDYMDIVQNKRRGVWNVPFINSAVMFHRSVATDPKQMPTYIKNLQDPDMAFCESLRDKGVFMYVSNRVDWGHLVDPSTFNTEHLHPDFFEIISNKWDWERRYIHPNYSEALKPEVKNLQPCPDVFWFPIVTERYCDELVAIMENFGQWSDGSNKDPRIDGGYENVPTRDIHMKQVDNEEQWLFFLEHYVLPLALKVFQGYDEDDKRIEGGYENVPTVDIHWSQIGGGADPQWLKFLKDYVYPLVVKVFDGYESDDPRLAGGYENVPTVDVHMKQVDNEPQWLYFLRHYVQPAQLKSFQGYASDPPKATMNFVVRYRPDEQPSLRPHHDASTYTINIALNKVGIDYQGGGCCFPRYNCCVRDTKKGWMLMHPGSLTHLHEGKLVTNGTRYIMVSFVDPVD